MTHTHTHVRAAVGSGAAAAVPSSPRVPPALYPGAGSALPPPGDRLACLPACLPPRLAPRAGRERAPRRRRRLPVAQSKPGGVTSRLTRKKCRGDGSFFGLLVGGLVFVVWWEGFFLLLLGFFEAFFFFFPPPLKKPLPGRKAPDLRLRMGCFRVSRRQRFSFGNCWDVIANTMGAQWRYREVAVDLCSYASYVERLRISRAERSFLVIS